MSVLLGYQQDFLGWNYLVPFPKMNDEIASHIAPVWGSAQPYLHYQKYSTVQHADRRMPIFTACNIDGSLFMRMGRTELSGGADSWSKDPRINPRYQFGVEFVSSRKEYI